MAVEPELRDMLLACADRAEELGDEVARVVLLCLTHRDPGQGLGKFAGRLRTIDGRHERAPAGGGR